jgi:uncharacterized membrane protein
MVAHISSSSKECRLVIRPNASMSWRETKTFFVATLIISAVIAVGFTSLGAWLVLPFAGLEMLALGLCLYVCAFKGSRYEMVAITDDEVLVQKGRRRVLEQFKFHRYWARVRLNQSRRGWYASRLKIISHGREVEIGSCLNEEERRGLALDLSQRLGQGGYDRHRYIDLAAVVETRC